MTKKSSAKHDIQPTRYSAEDLPLASTMEAAGVQFPEPFFWTTPALEALEAAAPGYGMGAFDASSLEVQRLFPNGPWLVAEGDSWFNHPFLTTICDWLRKSHGIYRSDRPGKTLREMLEKKAYLKPLLDHRAPKVKAVILSGGGNDLIGWKQPKNGYSPIFKFGDGTNAASYLDRRELKNALDTITALISQFAASVDAAKRGLPILTHCYDTIIPRKAPFGSHVYPQLLQVGAPPELHREITGQLQDEWKKRYEEVCTKERIHFINLKDITKTESRWADEIHPKSDPFHEMADRFEAKLKAIIGSRSTARRR